MNYLRFSLLTLLVTILGVLSSHTYAAVENVNCDKNGSLQDALTRHSGNSMPVDIYLSGTCRENVTVFAGPVWIFGENNAVIEGTLNTGANTVVINNVTITGAGAGLNVDGGNTYLFGVNVVGNEGLGIVATARSRVSASGSNISQNGQSGAYVALGSILSINNTEIKDNHDNGIQTDNNASISVDNGSVISGNSNGIHAYFHTSVTIANSTISENENSGILISKDSGVITRSNVTIDNNGGSGVYCEDDESSFENLEPVSDTISCTGFN